MLSKSIRWRIQAWHTALLVVLVAAMLGSFYAYERSERLRAVDNELQGMLTPFLPRLLPPHPRPGNDHPPRGPEGSPDFRPGPPGPDGPGDDGPERRNRPEVRGAPDLDVFTNGAYYYAVWDDARNLTKKSTNAPAVSAPPTSASKTPEMRTSGSWREVVFSGPHGESVLLGASIADLQAGLRRLALELTIAGVALVLFGFAGGWWVAGHALRPIAAVSATAREIAGGNRSRRINTGETESELGQMAEVLNHTFDRLDSAFEQQVRFTADASHELRTPVSVILTQTQLALSRERAAEEYKNSLQICQKSAERMRALVNSLLELARVDSGELQLHQTDCDLSAIASEAIALVEPLAREKGAVIRPELAPARVHADAARLGQVAVNLIGNAIQHNAAGVEVRVTVSREGGKSILRVSDNGSGLAAADLPHVFERFYRADKSRGGPRPGTGLGLAISQAIVEAHGGKITAANRAPQGAVFTVEL